MNGDCKDPLADHQLELEALKRKQDARIGSLLDHDHEARRARARTGDLSAIPDHAQEIKDSAAETTEERAARFRRLMNAFALVLCVGS